MYPLDNRWVGAVSVTVERECQNKKKCPNPIEAETVISTQRQRERQHTHSIWEVTTEHKGNFDTAG